MGLICWLPLCGNSNNQGLLDITKSEIGSISYTDGKLGKALTLNSDGQGIRIDNIMNTLSSYSSYSICAWIYLTSHSTNHSSAIFSSGDWNNSNSCAFALYGYNSGYYKILVPNTLHWQNGIDLSSPLIVNTWYHIAITYDGSVTKAYINGEYVGNYSGGGITPYSEVTYANIGSATYYSGFTLKGKINDFRIYNDCISEKTVREIAKGLVCHYKLACIGGENLFKLSEVEPFGIVSYTVNNNVFSMTGSGNCGLVFPYTKFTVGKIYTLSFKFKKTGGTLINIGGHCGDFKLIKWYVDKNQSDIHYISGCPLPDNELEHKVSLTVECISGSSDNKNLYIQVNRMDYTPVEFDLWDVKLEEGDVATPWCPNPADALYSTLGFDDGIEYDCSGYGNHGTKVGDIAWSSDSARYSGSYKFDGTSHIKTGFSKTMNELTCSFWVKPNSSNGGYAIVTSNYNSPSSGFWIAVNCEGSGLWFFNGSYVKGNSILTNDTWYHCCFTYNNGIGKWYKNGELVTISDISSNGTSLSISNLSIGNSYTGSSWNTKFYGNISDFRLYAVCLSDSDIKALYNVSASVDKSGVLSAYEFVEGD